MRRRIQLVATVAVAACSSNPPQTTSAPVQAPPQTQTQPTQPTNPVGRGGEPADSAPTTGGRGGGGRGGAGGGAATAPQPYARVVTREAKTRRGLFTVHQIGDRLLFEIPRNELGKDMLVVGRYARTPAAPPAGRGGG